MKCLFILFFLGVTSASKGQSIENVQKRLTILNNVQKIRFDTTGMSKLPKFKFFCTAQVVILEKDSSETIDSTVVADYWKYYSVIDLNGDGLNDLVYSGPCNPYDQTAVFINDGKRLELVYDYPGEIVSLEKNGAKTTINCLKHAIGCDPDNELTEIVISKGSSPVTHRISYAGIPKLNLQNLTKIKVKGVLRWGPKEDDVDKRDVCSDRVVRGNHLLVMDRTVDAIKLDQSGEWILILYKKDKNKSIIGWIKNK